MVGNRRGKEEILERITFELHVPTRSDSEETTSLSLRANEQRKRDVLQVPRIPTRWLLPGSEAQGVFARFTGRITLLPSSAVEVVGDQ